MWAGAKPSLSQYLQRKTTYLKDMRKTICILECPYSIVVERGGKETIQNFLRLDFRPQGKFYHITNKTGEILLERGAKSNYAFKI